MATGAIANTSGKYKVGGLFAVGSRAIYSASSETKYGWYCEALAGWVKGTDTASNAEPTAIGQSSTIKNGGKVYSSYDGTTWGSVSDSVSTVTFVSITQRTSGNGLLSLTDGTLYGGVYAVSGSSLTFTATASTGSQLSSLTCNGTSKTSPFTIQPTVDTSISASFALTSYTLFPTGTSSGGVVSVKHNGSDVSYFPITVAIGDTLAFTCTALSGNRFSYLSVNGVRYFNTTQTIVVSGGSSDGTIEFYASFQANAQVVDEITCGSGGSVAITRNGTAVTIGDDGKFSTTVGAQYVITATPDSGKSVEGIYDGTTRVSTSSTYTFTQYDSAKDFTVAFKSGSTSGVVLYCGGDSSSTDTTWNGCSCTKTNSGTSYTFTPSAASGYSFTKLYIEDLDGTGKGKIINAGSSLTTTIDFNAKVVAIFKDNSSPSEPSDADQGHATAASASVKEWEGGTERMTATWKSRRNVFMKPISLSCARVYADGYGSSGPMLGVKQYESPSATDVSPETVSIVAVSQDAFRLPVRRPEKYVEVELVTDKQVFEVAVATSMGALCQRAT